MGLFSQFNGDVSSMAAMVSPTNVMGKLQGEMGNLLGVDPSNPCPGSAGSSGNSKNSGANDPCGGAENAIKGALLEIGLSAAAPSISELGSTLGGPFNSAVGQIDGGGAMGGLARNELGLNNITKIETNPQTRSKSQLATEISSAASGTASFFGDVYDHVSNSSGWGDGPVSSSYIRPLDETI